MLAKHIYDKVSNSAAPPYTEWYNFLDALADQKIASIVREFWLQAVEVCKPKILMAPAAMQLENQDYNFSLVWDHEGHHLDVDVDYASRLDWFYCNRNTNELDGTETWEIGIGAALAERLKLVAR